MDFPIWFSFYKRWKWWWGGWIGCIGGLGGWGASVVERAQQAEPEGMVRAWARRVVG